MLYPLYACTSRCQLERKVPGVPVCPPKKIIGNKLPSFLEQRREELQAWLRLVSLICITPARPTRCEFTRRMLLQLATNEMVCKCTEFHEFLRDQANVRGCVACAGVLFTLCVCDVVARSSPRASSKSSRRCLP
jgi:hypothetical protein